jgi:hypothetical protein
MPSDDVRKDFILASIGNHFSIEVKPEDLWSNEKLNRFVINNFRVPFFGWVLSNVYMF